MLPLPAATASLWAAYPADSQALDAVAGRAQPPLQMDGRTRDMSAFPPMLTGCELQ
jgi:hypothetical protein